MEDRIPGMTPGRRHRRTISLVPEARSSPLGDITKIIALVLLVRAVMLMLGMPFIHIPYVDPLVGAIVSEVRAGVDWVNSLIGGYTGRRYGGL